VKIRVLVLAAVLVAAGGCRTTAPILTISNAPLGPAPGAKVSMEEVSKAIWAAGKRLGWVIEEVRPGELTGTLKLRTHLAVVTIRHDTSTFSIHYKNSVNLRYSDQEIHRQYNNWVQNLARNIQSEMARPGSSSN
jgi:hypothetical protein